MARFIPQTHEPENHDLSFQLKDHIKDSGTNKFLLHRTYVIIRFVTGHSGG
jgi:hypothetical protein